MEKVSADQIVIIPIGTMEGPLLVKCDVYLKVDREGPDKDAVFIGNLIIPSFRSSTNLFNIVFNIGDMKYNIPSTLENAAQLVVNENLIETLKPEIAILYEKYQTFQKGQIPDYNKINEDDSNQIQTLKLQTQFKKPESEEEDI